MPKMAADIGPKFVSLKQEPSSVEAVATPKAYYPSFYIDRPISGISEKEIGEKIRAEIKIVPVSVNRNTHNGKETISYQVEVREIRIL